MALLLMLGATAAVLTQGTQRPVRQALAQIGAEGRRDEKVYAATAIERNSDSTEPQKPQQARGSPVCSESQQRHGSVHSCKSQQQDHQGRRSNSRQCQKDRSGSRRASRNQSQRKSVQSNSCYLRYQSVSARKSYSVKRTTLTVRRVHSQKSNSKRTNSIRCNSKKTVSSRSCKTQPRKPTPSKQTVKSLCKASKKSARITSSSRSFSLGSIRSHSKQQSASRGRSQQRSQQKSQKSQRSQTSQSIRKFDADWKQFQTGWAAQTIKGSQSRDRSFSYEQIEESEHGQKEWDRKKLAIHKRISRSASRSASSDGSRKCSEKQNPRVQRVTLIQTIQYGQ